MWIYYIDKSDVEHKFQWEKSTYEKIINEFGTISAYLDSLGVHFKSVYINGKKEIT